MTREHSSAGSEHLPYKQGVIGSNPIVPTEKPQIMWLFSYPYRKSKQLKITGLTLNKTTKPTNKHNSLSDHMS